MCSRRIHMIELPASTKSSKRELVRWKLPSLYDSSHPSHLLPVLLVIPAWGGGNCQASMTRLIPLISSLSYWLSLHAEGSAQQPEQRDLGISDGHLHGPWFLWAFDTTLSVFLPSPPQAADVCCRIVFLACVSVSVHPEHRNHTDICTGKA